ncbi:cobalamin biosynthesis protein CbiG [Bradyrhizobium liaoningense]
MVASSGSPITPVEARKISLSLHPTALAAIFAVSAVEARPVLPVKALALPELTTSARALPPFSLARHHSTGAEGHFDLVKTPATAVPLSITASSTSVRFL